MAEVGDFNSTPAAKTCIFFEIHHVQIIVYTNCLLEARLVRYALSFLPPTYPFSSP